MTPNKLTLLNQGILIAAFASLLTTGFTLSGHLDLKPFGEQSQAQQRELTLITPQTFERIEVGMNLTEVRGAVGDPGTEVSSSVTTFQYRWGDWKGAYILCEFEDGVLVRKARYNF